MTQELEVKLAKKTRTWRSPEMIAELIWEAERKGGTVRVFDRTTASEKKREFGLIGDLRGRHLSASVRAEVLEWIREAEQAGVRS